MKFRRMLATILSALMVMSAFAFTAWAQEEEAEAELMATGILKEFSGSVGGLGGGMDKSSTKTKYYDAVNDVVFYRFKINDDAAGGTFHWNWYTYTINMDTDDNTVNAAYRMRTNKAGAVPHLKLYQAELVDANGAAAGTYNGTAIVGDGNWETAKVAITNSNVKLFKQLHTYLAGTGAHPAGFWFDVAYGTIANDEATAVSNVEDATKYASEYDIKFNLNYEGAEDLDTYPTEIPDRIDEGFHFEGWATKADATEDEVEYTDLTCVAVPTANTTYYAVWGDLIEEENAVYISADGNDANGGRHSEDAVLTLSKAMTLLNTNGLNTLYVVGNVDGTGTPGISAKKIYIEGYSGDGTEVLSHTGHWKFGGDVEFSNITIFDSDDGDGRHLAQGHNITFNDTVKTKDTDEWLGQGYYGSFSNIDNTVVVNGGTWNRFYFGGVTDSRITGKTVYEIGGNAKVNYIYTGHGAGSSTQSTKGTTYININGGTVSIDVGGSQDGKNSSHVGLRYFTLNGGTVTKFNTRTRHTYSTYEGYTVFEINKGATIPDTIGETGGTTDDSESRIVIFNDGAAVKPVSDKGAMVLHVTGANLKADVTVDSAYKATHNGFTYTLTGEDLIGVIINDIYYDLSSFTDNLIPAGKFKTGVNTVDFVGYEDAVKDAKHIQNYIDEECDVIYVSENGSGLADGSTKFDTLAYADMASVLSAYVKKDAKVVIAIAGGMPAGTAIPTTESGAEVIITSAYGNAGKDGGYISISGTSTPLRLGSGSSYTFDNIHFAVNNGAQNQIYASGSDVTVTSTVTHSATSQGLVLAHGRNSTDSFAGGTITADANVYLLRSGAAEGNNVTGDVRYVINKNAVIDIVGAGGHAGNVAGTDNAVLKGSAYVDINGGTVKQLNPGYRATVNGDVIATINNGGKVTSLKTQFEDANGVLKGDYVIYLNDGIIENVETFKGGTFNGKKVLIVNEDTSDVPATADSLIPYIVTSTGDGTVTFDTASDKLVFAMGNGVKYIRVTNGEDVKSFNVDGDEVALMADIAVDITEGTTTVEFLADGTEGKTVTFISDGEEVQSGLVEVGTVPTAPTLTKTGYTLGWDKEIVSVTEDVTYTAVWTAKEYDVTFNAGDGTFENGKEVTVKATFDSEISAPTEVPVREGYTFAGWTPEVGTLTTEGASFTAIWNLNKYTITFNAGDGKFSDDSTVKTVEADHGTTPTAPETPSKDGYTFKEWTPAIEAATGAVTYTATYEKDFATTSTYKTYGYYDALSDTYKVEVKFSGANVNQGSFGFNFPTEYMTFKSATANSAAGIEFLGADSPIYANGEGFYADTWAVSLPGFAGHIDATAEEVLIANIDFTMTEAQRTAFINAGLTLTEYVVASPNAKYHNGENYLATLYATDFSTTRQAIVYDSHTDEEVTTKAFYTTYGTYDSLREEYTIDIKVKGAKINVGAFGLKFNPAHMTFDPAVDEYGNAVNVTMAPDVANYLGIVLNNTAEGYAFVFDGSENTDGYVDASLEEVLIATVKVNMTAEQRTAFENAGKKMEIFVPTVNDNITAETLAAHYNGENYLVSLYTNGLEIPRIPAIYEAHYDEVLEVTEAHVEVTVNFTSKQGATASNIAYISLDNEATALETAGNTSTSATKTYEFLEVGKSYKIRVEKNGYLAAEVNYTVAAGDNKIVIDLIAGDIKGAKTDRCGDGKIDLSDFVRLIRAFDTDASGDFIATVDIDESGAVNVADLAIIKANYNRESAETVITYNGEEAAG